MFFSDVIGQSDIKDRLIKSVKENRVSHAHLFLGPEGSGKLGMAIAYARFISCLSPKADDACGVCRNCIKFNNLAHPDLHFIFPVAATKEKSGKVLSRDFMEKWREIIRANRGYFDLPMWYDYIGLENKQGIISAEDCNEIIKALSLKSFEGEFKFMIIWMAEKLFHSAAPKLLKILEEPPDKTLFLLIAENQDQLLPTIVSRTQILRFPRLPESLMAKALVQRFSMSEDAAFSVAAMSEGSFSRSLNYASIGDDSSQQFDWFTRFMRLCYKRYDKYFEINELISELSGIGREKQKHFLNYAIRLSRQCLLINHQKQDLVSASHSEQEFLSKFYPFINSKNANLAIEELESALYHVERNGNPKIIFTDLSLRFARVLRM